MTDKIRSRYMTLKKKIAVQDPGNIHPYPVVRAKRFLSTVHSPLS